MTQAKMSPDHNPNSSRRTGHVHACLWRCGPAMLLALAPATLARAQDPLPLAPPAVNAPALAAADPVAKTLPALEEVAAFRNHLKLQLRAWEAWLQETANLTPEQREQIKPRIAEMVNSETTSYGATFRQFQATSLPDDFPYLFHLTGSPLEPRPMLHFSSLQDVLAGDVLTKQQMDQSSQAGRERINTQRAAFLALLVQRVDVAARLSEVQQAQLLSDLKVVESNLSSPFFSVRHSAGFPSRPLRPLLTLQSRRNLDPVQLDLLDVHDIAAQKRGVELDLEPIDVWREKIDLRSVQFRDQIYQYYQRRIEQIEYLREVPSEAAERLRTAAKGAAVSQADQWTVQSTERIDRLQTLLRARVQPGVGFHFSLAGPEMSTVNLDSHPLWQRALTGALEISPWKQVQGDRAAWQRAARAGAVLAMLDHELWLTPAQREQLLPRITRVLTGRQPASPENENLALLGDLALPLHLLPPEEIEPILNTNQLEVWKVLAAHFEFRETSAGAQASTRGGGSIEWRWLKEFSISVE